MPLLKYSVDRETETEKQTDQEKQTIYLNRGMKIGLTQKFKFCLGSVENIVGKGENAGYQHFLLFLQCFQKASVVRSLKVGIMW